MNRLQMRELIVKDRKARIDVLRELLVEKFKRQYTYGSQLPVQVKTKEGDEPAIERLLFELEQEGMKMTYHFDDERGEYILIHAQQPAKK